MFFPLNIISSIGIGITLAISLLLLTNLTFTPAFLLLIGNWVEPSKIGKERTSNSENYSDKDTTILEGKIEQGILTIKYEEFS